MSEEEDCILYYRKQFTFPGVLPAAPAPGAGSVQGISDCIETVETSPLVGECFLCPVLLLYFFECSYYSEPKGGDRVSVATVHQT